MRRSSEAAYFAAPFELSHRRAVEGVCRPRARLSLLNDVARLADFRIGLRLRNCSAERPLHACAFVVEEKTPLFHPD